MATIARWIERHIAPERAASTIPDPVERRMTMPPSAMVLAAGLGTRLRPLTDRIPKPLVEVAGPAPLIDHVLGRLEEAGVEHAVVNAHYKAAMIAAHLEGRRRPRIELSVEDDLLETGGGVTKALHSSASASFVVNSDIVWLDGASVALRRLADAWDDAAMDALLLLQRVTTAVGYEGRGDFALDPLGVPRRRHEREVVPYVFAGIQILHRRLFAAAPAGPSSRSTFSTTPR